MLLKLVAAAALETGSKENPAPGTTLLKGYMELLAPDEVSNFDFWDKFIVGGSVFLGFLLKGSSLLSFSKWPRSGETPPLFSELSPREDIKLASSDSFPPDKTPLL